MKTYRLALIQDYDTTKQHLIIVQPKRKLKTATKERSSITAPVLKRKGKLIQGTKHKTIFYSLDMNNPMQEREATELLQDCEYRIRERFRRW